MLITPAMRDSAAYLALSMPAKLMLMTLATYADSEGRCYPSIDRLSAGVGITRRHVFRVMAELEASGCLARKRRGPKTSEFVVSFGIKRGDTGVTPTTKRGDMGVTSNQKEVTWASQRGDMGVTQNISLNIKHNTGVKLDKMEEKTAEDARERGTVWWTEHLINRGISTIVAAQLARAASPETIRNAIDAVGGTNSPGLLVHRIREAIARQKRSNAISVSDWDVGYARG